MRSKNIESYIRPLYIQKKSLWHIHLRTDFDDLHESNLMKGHLYSMLWQSVVVFLLSDLLA